MKGYILIMIAWNAQLIVSILDSPIVIMRITN